MKTTMNQTSKAFKKHLTATKNNLARQFTGQANNRGQGFTIKDIKSSILKIDKHAFDYDGGAPAGATKKCFFPADGIAVCVANVHPAKICGNQFKTQFEFWEKIASSEDGYFFNPILRICLHRGDKVHPLDDRYFGVCALVSQKAQTDEYMSFYDMVLLAYDYNNREPFKTFSGRLLNVEDYTQKARATYERYNLRDIYKHVENYGIIYDYSLNQYRVVALDYAI